MADETLYHVFLSHNSADKPAVEAIAHRLREEARLQPFLDKWHLIPGQPWQEALEGALDESATVAVFIGPSGVSPWHNEEMRAALDYAVRTRDEYRVIPVLLPGAEEESLTGFLARRTWVDFRPGLDDADAFNRLVAGVLGQPPEQAGPFTLPDELAPYPGLQPFTAQQATFFFGRTNECNRLLKQVRASSFVAVVGASGSGKSSLVLAGLLPAMDEGWHTLTLVPGTRPLRALADQLATLAPADGRLSLADDLETRLADRADGLNTVISTLLADHPDIATLLVVIDQFEELFTQVIGAPEEVRQQQRQLVANLVDAVNGSRGQVRVVLTLRADFVKHCLDFPDLRALLEVNQHLLGSMGGDALREAIVKPAQAVGAMFEKGLVARLVNDMRDQPAALPLLQFALAQLWQRRHGVWLTHAAYEDIGGVSGAIDQRAEEVYAKLNESQQHLTRNLFLRLVALGEDISDTRRRVRREELDLVGTAAEDVEGLIGILSRSDVRLITTGADTIELAHEALIEQWERLHRWLQADRIALRIHRELTKAAQEWERRGRDASYLYRGSRLTEVEQWTASSTADLSALEYDFITASVTAQRAELAAQRQRRALRVAVLGLSVLVGIALVALAWMFATNTGLFEPRERWVRLGDLETWVNTIGVDPQIPETLYVGMEDGRLLKSLDRGASWNTVLTIPDGLWIVNVALTPDKPETLYVGTSAGTLFRSNNGGGAWLELGPVSDATYVNYLALDPLDPETAYICDADHPNLYKSTDGGASWAAINVAPEGEAISALSTAVVDGMRSVVYVGSSEGNVWRSLDRGASWQGAALESPLPYVVDIVTHPADANVLYVATTQGLYRLRMQGARAQVQLLVADLDAVELAVDPRSPGVVFISTDNGNVYLVQDAEDRSRYQLIASEQEFLHASWTPWLAASNREPYFLYAATEYGVFGWLPSRQAATWLD